MRRHGVGVTGLVALALAVSIFAFVANAFAVDSSYALSVVAGRPYVVSGTPATENHIGVSATATDSSGNVYVADLGYGRVYEITPAGILSVFAGDGDLSATAPVAGPATSSSLHPVGVAVDGSGTVFISDYRGYVESVTASGTLSIVAGDGQNAASPVAGQATSSSILPRGIALDPAGDVYVSDVRGFVVKVTPADLLSIVAGDGQTAPFTPPTAGSATSSSMLPAGLALDTAGDLYIADRRGFVLEVAPSGTLAIIAGNGADSTPVSGPATASPMFPTGVALDTAGNLYVSDPGEGYVYKITPAGTLSIFAGRGGSASPSPGPATSSPLYAVGLSIDGVGNVYIADGNGYVDKVTSGGVLSIFAGDGHGNPRPPIPGPATSSPMAPNGITLDAAGNMFVSDATANYVYKITPVGTLSIIAGNGTRGAPIPGPATASPVDATSPIVDAHGNIYLADMGTIVKITPSGTLSVVAGNGDINQPKPVPGPATQSPLRPWGVTLDAAGDLYIADANGYVEKVTPSGILSILAGTGNTVDPPVPGPANRSPITPEAITLDAHGNLYTAGSNRVEKIAPSGTLSIIAGNGQASGTPNSGPATASPIVPRGLAVDSLGNVYIADQLGYVEDVSPSGTLSIIAGNRYWRDPGLLPTAGPATSSSILPVGGITIDPTGVLYVADALYIVKLEAPALSAATPTVTGTARIGDTLTAIPGTWTPGTVTLTYQWLANGSAINGATHMAYTPTAGVLGRRLSVRITGYETGYTASTSTSTQTGYVAAGTITERSRPYLSGTQRVGYTLTIHPGGWTPSGVTLRYQWLRDGRAFSRIGTGNRYKLTTTDRGHRLSARVIVSKAGYTSRIATTAPTVRIT